MKQRLVGIDLARALAVFGMVVVNYKIALNAVAGSGALIFATGLLEGRAAALFVILAGVGIAFLSNRPAARRDLLKRGVIFAVIGLAYLPVWPADILHFYGAYFLIGAALLTASARTLLVVAGLVTLAFPVLLAIFDYDRHWDWLSLTYHHLWTPDGMVRHLLFNGFHPVVPWVAFLLFGMWLGRQALSDTRCRLQLFIGAVVVLLIVESALLLARYRLGDGLALQVSPEEARLLLSSSMMPPLPQYMLSAAASGTATIMVCLWLAERFAGNRVVVWGQQTGRLALTLYIAHVLIGLGILEAIGQLTQHTIGFAVGTAAVFCVAGMVFSVLWLKHFRAGPLEAVIRRITRSSARSAHSDSTTKTA